MTRKIVFTAALSVLLSATAPTIYAQAQARQKPANFESVPKPNLRPDLVVVSIDFKNYKTFTSNGSQKGSVLPSVTYKNQGSAPSGTFKLAWEYFDYATNSWQFWLQSTYLTNSLAAGGGYTQGGQLSDEFTWTIGAQWPKFRCRLDVQNTVTESNESNNELTKTYRPFSSYPETSSIRK